MAHANWIIQVPGMRRFADTDSNAHANSNSDTDSDADTNANPDSATNTGGAEQSDGEWGFSQSNQFELV